MKIKTAQDTRGTMEIPTGDKSQAIHGKSYSKDSFDKLAANAGIKTFKTKK